jgi:hypothetical protein
MNVDIDRVLGKVAAKMQANLSAGKYDEVTRLSAPLSRLRRLKEDSDAISNEVLEMERNLEQETHNGSLPTDGLSKSFASPEFDEPNRGRPQTLHLEIDWRANHRSHPREEICENTAAACLAIFVSRLIEEFGEEAIEKLAGMRINRGPLISQTPAKDFVNRAKGNLYGHKKIRGTGYYLLTHSSTPQKIEDIKRICKVIGLVAGSVTVKQTDRQNMYA